MYEWDVSPVQDFMMSQLLDVAPSGDSVTEYDRYSLSLYAALLDADEEGAHWREVAAHLMQIDPERSGAECCWRSHLERARWIVGEGLPLALASFDARSGPALEPEA
jgi:hypothetical protein